MRTRFEKWDERFLHQAKEIAKWSKDPSTKVGAVVVRELQILSTGYNGFPRNMVDNPKLLEKREEKLLRTVHAEANAVAQAALNGVSLRDSTIYIWPLIPCAACATLLAQAGIVRIVSSKDPVPARWLENMYVAECVLKEVGVELRRI